MDGDLHILSSVLDFSQPSLPNFLDCASLGLNISHFFQAGHLFILTYVKKLGCYTLC